MVLNPKYPTIEHERTSEAIIHFFFASPAVKAVFNKKTGCKDKISEAR